MLLTLIRNSIFIKFILIFIAYMSGYIYGTLSEKERYDNELMQLENKRLNEILTIDRKNTILVNNVAEKYENDLSTIKNDYDKLRNDYSRLRVKTCNSVPTNAGTAPKLDEKTADGSERIRASKVDFAGIAGKIATIGEQLDKCYKQVDGLQEYIKVITGDANVQLQQP